MSSVQHLREFIRERLTAAAEEILTEVEKTFVRYEEDVRLLESHWKPQMKLTRIELQKPCVSNEEEALDIQQLCSQKRASSHHQEETEPQWNEEKQMEPDFPLFEEQGEPGPPWIKVEEEDPEPLLIKEENEDPWSLLEKEEQEQLDSSMLGRPTRLNHKDLGSSQEKGQLTKKQSIALMETSTLQGSNLCEGEPITGQLSFISPVVEITAQEGSSSAASERQPHVDTEKMSFKDDVCGRSFKNKHRLEQHYRTHTCERRFSCETCGASFVRRHHLYAHQRIHTGEKPFSCETCGKSFTQIASLNVHRKIHTGERPFSCEICGKGFIRRDHLDVHQRTHTGERPFSCEVGLQHRIHKRNRNRLSVGNEFHYRFMVQ
ncbi:zinc finger protein 287-like [Cyprinodon tularosa]|uniref:zinc finger protein 287-like n=1 Tax=Cyprinodon tularosa TaxID=77115 RepID=UPI0018E1EF0C|nr:zinc finger protein 287-like [Cyprinodon tularosa]XP_038133923.1 zinc finger protein 287-like [Cyprinodon tularosa]